MTPATPNERIALGRRAVDLAVGQGSVWALTADGVLLRIDPASAEILAEIVVGPGPSAVAVSDDGVWVAVGAALPRSSSLAGHFEAIPPGFQVDAIGPADPGEVCDPQSIVRNCVLVTSGPFEAAGGDHARARTRSRFGRAREARSSATGGRTAMPSYRTFAAERPVSRGSTSTAWGRSVSRWDRALSVHESVAPDAGVLCVLRTGRGSGSAERLRGQTGTMSDRGIYDDTGVSFAMPGTSSPIRPASRAPRRGSRYTSTARTRRRARRHVLRAGSRSTGASPGGRA